MWCLAPSCRHDIGKTGCVVRRSHGPRGQAPSCAIVGKTRLGARRRQIPCASAITFLGELHVSFYVLRLSGRLHNALADRDSETLADWLVPVRDVDGLHLRRRQRRERPDVARVRFRAVVPVVTAPLIAPLSSHDVYLVDASFFSFPFPFPVPPYPFPPYPFPPYPFPSVPVP